MDDWRNLILHHFQTPVHRLTLVADPDGLLLDEDLLAAIRRRGFDLLTFEDHVAFRYAYETEYRQHWDEGQSTELAVILRAPESSLRSLPYDLLQSGRVLTFSLHDILPKLSYPVIRELDHDALQRVYSADRAYDGPEMGDRATALYVLRHAFGIHPDMLKTPAGILRLLLSRHACGGPMPQRLNEELLALSGAASLPEGWSLERLLGSASEFFRFLQDQWTAYLSTIQPTGIADGSAQIAYAAVPFDEPDVRAQIAALFLEGKLKPVPLPEGWTATGWMRLGVEDDEQHRDLRRFALLLEQIAQELPDRASAHDRWIHAAEQWAELTLLRHRLASDLDEAAATRYALLHLEIERRFADWMSLRYHTLHSLSFLPRPPMVHHIPHWMASRLAQDPEMRLALVVVDGLALDQWRVIRDVWAAEVPEWAMLEGAAVAWVPTMTSISRQAIFAGTAPRLFPTWWASTAHDASHWERFWVDRGLAPVSIGYLRNLGTRVSAHGLDVPFDGMAELEPELRDLAENPQSRVLGLVVNTVDDIMHGMQLGTAGMHQQIRLWLTRYRYLTQLVQELMDRGYTVVLTSDHGNVAARGIGRPKEGVLVETRGERARIYVDEAFLALGKQQSPSAIEWSNVGLPSDLRVLLAPDLDGFLNAGDHAVCHGGISLEEVIVPFVEITRDSGQ